MSDITTLLCPEWIATVAPASDRAGPSGLLTRHAVAITDDGKIGEILPIEQVGSKYPNVARFDRPGHLLTPGFINLHAHCAMTLLRGYADDLGLHSWLNDRIWPAEGRCVSDRFVYDGAVLGMHEMLLGGTTLVNDMYFFPEETARAARALGMRASVGIMMVDFPSPYGTGPDDYLSKGTKLRDELRDDPLISFTVSPHAPYTVSDESFTKVRALSEELDLPIHLHVHETAFEVEDALTKHNERPISRLNRLGLIGPHLIAVHAVHLNEHEIELFAKHKVSVAHCPHSNLKLGSGLAPIAKLLDSSVNFGIGTDGSASNNQLDLLQETRTAALLAKGSTQDAGTLNAHQALHAMTLGGAIALGRERELGSIEAGKQADLALIALDSPRLQPVYDPVSQLIYAARGSDVTDVFVAGNHVVHRQQMVESSGSAAVSSVVARIPLWQNEISDAGH